MEAEREVGCVGGRGGGEDGGEGGAETRMGVGEQEWGKKIDGDFIAYVDDDYWLIARDVP